MSLLGGHALFLGSEDVQLGVNETVKGFCKSALKIQFSHISPSTSSNAFSPEKTIFSFVSLVTYQVFAHSDVEELKEHSTVPVINALSDMYHPLQTLADYMTLQEVFGEELTGKKIAWVGDGNNVLHDLVLAAPLLGCNFSICTPAGSYEPDPSILSAAKMAAEEHGTTIDVYVGNPKDAVEGADVVVTDTWVSMGEEEEYEARTKAFEGFQVTKKLMEGANPEWKFLHCLPRKQQEVNDDVFYDESRSLVFGRFCIVDMRAHPEERSDLLFFVSKQTRRTIECTRSWPSCAPCWESPRYQTDMRSSNASKNSERRKASTFFSCSRALSLAESTAFSRSIGKAKLLFFSSNSHIKLTLIF